MEHEKQINNNSALPASILVSTLILAGAWIYTSEPRTASVERELTSVSNSYKALVSILEEKVLPSEGVVLPVRLKDLGQKLVSVGVIDREKFLGLYTGTLREVARRLVDETQEEPLRVTSENAPVILNLLWAAGLGNKNEILEKGEMTDSRYGGAGRFSSTAGWTIASGQAMNHYSAHPFMLLTPEQQVLVDKVSRGIYRPCCGNSTHFPDCNHGMAMLGLLELMASQGVGEEDMWKTALAVNSYWFPDTYLTIATFMQHKGFDWKDVNPREMLGIDYSSAQGYAKVASQVAMPSPSSGGGNGCAVGSANQQVVPVRRQTSGCGV